MPPDAAWLPISLFPKAQVPAWSHSPPSLSLLEHLYPLSSEICPNYSLAGRSILRPMALVTEIVVTSLPQ